MASKATIRLAKDLLDRFFRDAEGRTNRQIDVYFAVQDMGLARDKVDEAIAFLTSRNLVNLFGTDIAFLTDKGVQVVAEDLNLAKLKKEFKDFRQVEPTVDVPSKVEPPRTAPPVQRSAPVVAEPTPAKPAGPAEPHLVHMNVDTGTEQIVMLSWVCRVGRAEGNEIQIDDKRASKVHAEFRYENNAYILTDRDSANGTLLNGEYVVEDMKLKHDDEVVIGRTMLLFQAPAGVSEPREPNPTSLPEPDPATVMAATERPAEADAVRVVRGTPDAVVQQPEPVDELFEPPVEDPPSDLFGDDAKDRVRSASAATSDLFQGGASDDVKPEDLFDDGSDGSEDLFSPPSRDIPQAPSTKMPAISMEDAHEAADALEPSESTPPWSADTPMPQVPGSYDGPPPEEIEPPTQFQRDADLLANQPVISSDEESILEGEHLEAVDDDEVGEDNEATMMVSRSDLEEQLQHEPELPSWGDAPAPSDSHPSFVPQDEVHEEDTATLTPDDDMAAEDLPLATPSLSMPAVSAPSRVSDGPFMSTLQALKQHTERADLPDRAQLVEAIELIAQHPYVRVALDLIED